MEFMRSIVAPVKGILTHQMFNYYMDFTNPNFIDEYEEEEHKNPEKLYGVESAHYTICYLFDLLQFTFQFMVMTEPVLKKEEGKMEVDDPKAKIYDHRKPIDAESDLVFYKFKYYFESFEDVLSEVT